MGQEAGARCGECGRAMQRRRSWQRYCSTACRLRAFWRRRLVTEVGRDATNTPGSEVRQ